MDMEMCGVWFHQGTSVMNSFGGVVMAMVCMLVIVLVALITGIGNRCLVLALVVVMWITGV